ncbi:hypothetical protein GCM10027026_46420 [Myroides odoratimimus subsp. xuanwuensis]
MTPHSTGVERRAEPLPYDVAEWMGMDQAMVPALFALTTSTPDDENATSQPSRMGILRLRRSATARASR